MTDKGKNIQIGSGNIEGNITFNSGSIFNTVGNVKGDQIVSVAEAAAEIQTLLEQLSQVHPTSSVLERMQTATEAVAYIEKNPTLMKRIFTALKAGGVSALEQNLNHPAASFVIAALEDWQESQHG